MNYAVAEKYKLADGSVLGYAIQDSSNNIHFLIQEDAQNLVVAHGKPTNAQLVNGCFVELPGTRGINEVNLKEKAEWMRNHAGQEMDATLEKSKKTWRDTWNNIRHMWRKMSKNG
jgi:hypothetical protein